MKAPLVRAHWRTKRREAALRDHDIPQRRACRLVGVAPKTVRRERPPDCTDIHGDLTILGTASTDEFEGVAEINDRIVGKNVKGTDLVLCDCEAVVGRDRSLVGPFDCDGDRTGRACAMLVGRRDLHENVARFARGKVLHIAFGLEIQVRSVQPGLTFDRCACDRVDQRGAVVVAVHIAAKGRQVQRLTAFVDDRRHFTGGHHRSVVLADDTDFAPGRVAIAVDIGHAVLEDLFGDLAEGQFVEGTGRLEAEGSVVPQFQIAA